jgi:signal transduction histidine kinase
VDDVGAELKALAAHYRSDAAVAPIVAELAKRINEKLSEVATSIELFEQGRHDAWRELMLSNIGKEKMDAIREAATALLDIETGRIVEQRRQVVATLNLGRIGVGVLLLLSLAALALYLRQSAAVAAAQREHQAALRAERDRLEDEVAHRTTELTELTRHLQTAREDERSRLARELHDELGALLTAAKLDVARLKRSLADTDAPSEERLAHLAETLNSGIALKRRIIEDLHPSALSNLGLVAALQAQARDFGQRSGVATSVELSEVELDNGAQITVYRLVQEALTNIAKHAKATRVWIGLRVVDGQVLVSVRDDGQGFDAKAVPRSTHGLTGMRYRVEAEGGTMRVRATPGRGTLIEASLPAAPRV